MAITTAYWKDSSPMYGSGMDEITSTIPQDDFTISYSISTENSLTISTENSLDSNSTNEMNSSNFGDLQNVVSIILYIVLAISMFGIGCGVDLRKLLVHFKKPTGAVIGIVSQFVIMPLASFILALILQMNPIRTLTLLILGSCPGGSVSNVAVVWVEGDVDLSVCMTTISCILAFGVMPLLLYIYSFAFSDTLEVPFQSIGITLVIVFVPISIGAFFRTKKERIAKILLKVFSTLGIIAIIALIILALLTYGRSFSLAPGQIISAFVLPFCGLVLGYGLSSLVGLYKPWRLQHFQRRTIALEIGIQNAQLALGIINLSGFSREEIAEVILFPVIYLTGQAFWIIVMIIAYKVYRRYQPLPDDEESYDSSVEETKSNKVSAEFINPVFDSNKSPPEYSKVEEYKSTNF